MIIMILLYLKRTTVRIFCVQITAVLTFIYILLHLFCTHVIVNFISFTTTERKSVTDFELKKEITKKTCTQRINKIVI